MYASERPETVGELMGLTLGELEARLDSELLRVQDSLPPSRGVPVRTHLAPDEHGVHYAIEPGISLGEQKAYRQRVCTSQEEVYLLTNRGEGEANLLVRRLQRTAGELTVSNVICTPNQLVYEHPALSALVVGQLQQLDQPSSQPSN